jgi:F-box and leucine-rich repeat protein GRR1
MALISRQPRSASRRPLSNSNYASSASTSPERRPDEDTDSIMLYPNDSVSSLADSITEEQDALDREMEELCRVSPISRLPAELMIQIFQKLPKPSDLLNCMLVSRSWARNSVALLWHRPATTSWQPLQKVVHTLRNSDTAFDYHRLVKRVNLAQLDVQVSDGVLLPFNECKRVERLTLTKCSKLSDLSLTKVIDGNSSLMALDITNVVHATDRVMDMVAKNCFRLQGLNITNCWNITSEGLENVARNCRHIKRVSHLRGKLGILTGTAQMQWMLAASRQSHCRICKKLSTALGNRSGKLPPSGGRRCDCSHQRRRKLA